MLSASPVAVADSPVPLNVYSVATDSNEWLADSLAQAGITLAPTTQVLFSDVANCGGVGGGCTYVLPERDVVVISPAVVGTEAGTHILFHELAHAQGELDECEAENWAHSFEAVDLWSYPQCEAGFEVYTHE